MLLLRVRCLMQRPGNLNKQNTPYSEKKAPRISALLDLDFDLRVILGRAEGNNSTRSLNANL